MKQSVKSVIGKPTEKRYGRSVKRSAEMEEEGQGG